MDELQTLRDLKDTLSELNGFWSTQYDRMKDDLEFYGGRQWGDDRLKKRKGRPNLTANTTALYISRVVNSVRVSPYGINVSCENKEMEELLSGILKQIEYDSNAKDAYCTALEHATATGLGFIHIDHDYVDGDSYEQEIKICKVSDPRKVMLDPYAEGVGDARYGIYFSHISSDRATELYGEDAGSGKFFGIDIYNNFDVPSDSVCDLYWYRLKEAKQTKYLLSDGSEIVGDIDYTELATMGVYVVNERTTSKKVCETTHIVGSKIIGTTELDIPFIPLVPVYGKRIYQEDVRFGGVVRDLRGLQEALNYVISTETELIANAPKTPFIIGTTQIQGLEKFWEGSAEQTPAYLPYNPISGVAPPSRADNTAQTQGLAQTRQMLQADMGRVVGIFDGQLGAGEVEQSGIALQVRNSAGDIASATYVESLEDSVQQVGRVILAMMPIIYDSERVMSVRGEQGIERVSVNVAEVLKANEVDVYSDAGPSYETRRRESTAALLQVLDVLPPEEKPKYIDLVISQLELPNKAELLNRVSSYTNADESGEMDPQALEALQTAEQTIGQLQETVNQAGAIIQQLQGLLISKDKEMQTKVEIERMKIEKDLAVAQLREASQNEREAAKIAADASKAVAEIVADSEAQEKDIQSDLLKEAANLQAKNDETQQKIATEIIKANASSRTAGPLTL